VIIGATYLVLAVLEWMLPYRVAWRGFRGDVATDLAHFFFTAIPANEVVKFAVNVVVLAAAGWGVSGFGLGVWPVRWPMMAQLFLAVLLAELGHYWFHRWAHEWGWLWRFHAVHHSARRLYWLNATRFHPVDLFGLLLFQYVPLFLLGIPAHSFAVYAIFTGVYGQLQHCNVDVQTGHLRWLFSTPELHRWHHSTVPDEGNSNYGAIFSVWDWVFGTFFFPSERRFVGPVGVADQPDFPASYLQQLASPFRARA
jgi:sterol desaturase/sphingolipid hydroxylase (fatty acid hydroxylase superfamily)